MKKVNKMRLAEYIETLSGVKVLLYNLYSQHGACLFVESKHE